MNKPLKKNRRRRKAAPKPNHKLTEKALPPLAAVAGCNCFVCRLVKNSPLADPTGITVPPPPPRPQLPEVAAMITFFTTIGQYLRNRASWVWARFQTWIRL